jgi:formylglycine-generating enzyme required for sulfatase activity
MHGNAFEWCEDVYFSDYGQRPAPIGSGTASQDRVLRGGGWGYRTEEARSAFRKAEQPKKNGSNNGFRIARTIGENPVELNTSRNEND